MIKPEDKNKKCPECKQPPSIDRWKGGVKNFICGNGHNWPDIEEEKPKSKEPSGYVHPFANFKP